MIKDFEKAKKLFFTYGGNHFLMKKDGVYEDYLSHNISKEQETQWGKEQADNLINKFYKTKLMDEDAHKLFDLFKLFSLFNDFSCLVQSIDKNVMLYDSFTKLLFLESCEGLIEFFKNNKRLSTKDIMNLNPFLLNILKSISSKNISIDSYYKEQAYMADFLDKELVYERIKGLNLSQSI